MKLPHAEARPRAGSTVSLINIVFLMLIFFLLAGSLAAPPDRGLHIPETSDIAISRPPVDMASVSQAGDITIDGRTVAASGLAAVVGAIAPARKTGPLKLVADRRADARALIRIIADLKAGGFARISLVTIRGRRGS